MKSFLRSLVAPFGLMLVLAASPLRAQDAADMLLRLDRLEAENRRLNGQIEEMKFQVRRLEDQLKRQQSDYDLRFRDLEQGRGGARPQAATPAPATPQPNPRRQDAFDPAQLPAAPGAPRPLTPGQPGSGDINAPLDVTRNPRATAPAVPPPVGPKGDARTDFEAARRLVQSGDFEGGELAFREFLRNHPRDRRLADANFFIGESLLNRTRYREAAEAYLTVTTRHANAARAPEAMLKLGIALRGLGAKAEACGTFDQVPKKYPNASGAIKAAVEREKVRAQC